MGSRSTKALHFRACKCCLFAGKANSQAGIVIESPKGDASESEAQTVMMSGTGGPGAVKPRPGVKGKALGAFLQRLRQEAAE